MSLMAVVVNHLLLIVLSEVRDNITIDFNVFMMRLQEQDDWVASWSDSTVTKVKQVLARILVDNEYLDSTTADHLNPVLIYPILEDAIRSSGDTKALTAFNCLA